MTPPTDDRTDVLAPGRPPLLDAYLAVGGQLARSYGAALAATRGRESAPPRSLSFCGMGGSAAAADVIMAGPAAQAVTPVAISRGYGPPNQARGPEDLVVCLSYSGATEEALDALEKADARGCRVVAVSAGGPLAERAADGGHVVVQVPGGAPMPRAALGYLTGATLGALRGLGALPLEDAEVERTAQVLDERAAVLGEGSDVDRNEALRIAAWLADSLPVIWGTDAVTEAAAWRWKCAFNENAKIPAFSSTLPELDHHEVEGWAAGRSQGFRLVVLRHDGEPAWAEARLRASLEVVQAGGLEWTEVRAAGPTPLARVLSLMLVGDAASVYHALGRGVDPAPIDAIVRVKRALEGSR